MNLVRDYALPLILALLVHAGAAAALLRSWQPQADEPQAVQPRVIQAKLVARQKRVRKPPAPAARNTASPPPQAAQPKPKPKPPQPPKPAPQPDPEAERRSQEEARRQQRLRELYEKSTARALEEEIFNLEAGAADAETMIYVDAIYKAIVAQWSRPPSARNDMRARFRVELVPSGDLLDVMLLESSGNAAFDRSAQAAVRKVGRYPVPEDRNLFEAKFRRFTLLFEPTDLLR